MKKNSLIFLLLSLLLFGCQSSTVEREKDAQQVKENEPLLVDETADSEIIGTISLSALPEETERILSALSIDNVSLFDVKRLTEARYQIRVWVEMFEEGVKQGDLLNMGMETGIENQQDSSQTSQLLLSFDFNEEQDKVRSMDTSFAIIDNNGSSSTEAKINLASNPGGRLTHTLNTPRELKFGEPVTIVTVIEDSGSSMSYDEREIIMYDEAEETPQKLLKYDRVILFRAVVEEVNKE